MTQNGNLKRRVRARAAKTGESYTAALRHVRQTSPDHPEPETKSVRLAVAQTTLFNDPRDISGLRASGIEMRRLIREAHKAGARLVHFPEGAEILIFATDFYDTREDCFPPFVDRQSFAEAYDGDAHAPPNFQIGMPSFFALSARLSWMPVPGKTMTPIGSTSSIWSLRLKGAARPCFAQSGAKPIWGTPR